MYSIYDKLKQYFNTFITSMIFLLKLVCQVFKYICNNEVAVAVH